MINYKHTFYLPYHFGNIAAGNLTNELRNVSKMSYKICSPFRSINFNEIKQH